MPITRPADALLAYSPVLAMMIGLLIAASYRNVELRRRILLAVGFQMGTVFTAALMFMRYSPMEYAQDLGTIMSLGSFMRVIYYLVLTIACVSPLITYLFIRDAKRHPMHYVKTHDGRRQLMSAKPFAHHPNTRMR